MNQNEQNNQNLQNQNIANQGIPTQNTQVPNTPIQNTTQAVPPNVVPMPEVQVTEAVISTPVENTMSNNNVTNQNSVTPPPKSSKGSTILLILLFLFFFAVVMGMPYIQEFVNSFKENTSLSEIEQEAKKEEERQQQQNTNQPTPTPEVEQIQEVTCTSPSEIVGNYTLVKIEKFFYNNKNQILNSSSISQYTFSTPDDNYQTLKTECSENSLKYIEHPGYEIACSYSDVNIRISYSFDLKNFTPIIDGTTNIYANANYQQDITTTKNNLINQGYTCE